MTAPVVYVPLGWVLVTSRTKGAAVSISMVRSKLRLPTSPATGRVTSIDDVAYLCFVMGFVFDGGWRAGLVVGRGGRRVQRCSEAIKVSHVGD